MIDKHEHVYAALARVYVCVTTAPGAICSSVPCCTAVDHFCTSIEELRLGMALAERQKRARQEKSNKEGVAQAIRSL